MRVVNSQGVGPLAARYLGEHNKPGRFTMNIYRHFLDSSLRFKILFGLLLSLLPMLVIMGISYTSARSNAVETSEPIDSRSAESIL